ncbi:predicted protein [Lichtheimia corymbifera JMRC:FSU:9682]|uniref:Uncharacterized protein n=1 Tax=Lichtheimia corymbifera JMRC:FSU:9682 TaxID=1263082 RepID=A0A068RW22_9FUNG|nr:predicted protein [Lichtheimia corymbifera JMRC:FSU:9682]
MHVNVLCKENNPGDKELCPGTTDNEMKQKDVANPCRDSRFSPPFDMAPISDETSQGKCIIQNLDFRSIGSSVGGPTFTRSSIAPDHEHTI